MAQNIQPAHHQPLTLWLGIFLYPKKGGAMKDWSDLESGRANHFNGHFAPGHGCNLKELIRVVDGHE